MIADTFALPGRFLRSVQLERDFLDPAALESYIATPPMAEALHRILEGIQAGSQSRAWRITGDYGVGKSSLALVLARLLSDPTALDSQRVAEAIQWNQEFSGKRFLPILVTGTRESLPTAVARGVRDSILQQGGGELISARLDASIAACEKEGSVRALEELVSCLLKRATESNLGVLLILDELGKLLEYAAMNPDREDVFALQRLGELAARSGDRPFLLVGILHQGFQAYAERLPLALRHEWDKVAGRFEEVVFDQPLVHTAALVAGALGVDKARLSNDVRVQAEKAFQSALEIGWMGAGRNFSVDHTSLYPLHPTLLPVMVRFFSHFGQSERSLFGFLLSSEPMALQAFSATTPVGTSWFDISSFYDYVRSSFGHRLSATNFQSQWLRIVATIDGFVDASPLELKVLKTVGLLNLLDADDLLPTRRSVIASLSMFRSEEVSVAIEKLGSAGLLFERGATGAYRLWPNSSVNLQAAVQAADRAIGAIDVVAPALINLIEGGMVLARRHYLETGTMRYFEVRYCAAADLATTATRPTEADGLIIMSLVDQKEQQAAARDAAIATPVAEDPSILVGLLPPVWHLSAYLRDVILWQWVESNLSDLANDDFASAEVQRQVTRSRQALRAQFDALTRVDGSKTVEWIYKGQSFDAGGNLPKIVSQLCSDLYPLAPRVTNELLNRNALSSAAASARMRLIEGMFESSGTEFLGIDASKSPPEKSMYLSVLQRGALHVKQANGFVLQTPPPMQDQLQLRPSLLKIIEIVRDGRGCRVAVSELLATLAGRPFGVRSGLAPILLALVIKEHAHELALYENGTFISKFGAMEFLRLTKAPQTFEIQHCSVEGVRSEVFVRLAGIFAKGVNGRQPVLLDVVTQLCQFAAQLPEYTRKTRALSSTTLAVRDTLLSAREPATLIFTDLPRACRLSDFAIGQADDSSIDNFIERLSEAISELQNAYGELVKRIVRATSEAIGQNPEQFDRVTLASRAARVSLAAREPRLRAFALRLRDPALHDQAWAESLASFVVSKPPSRWLPGDEVRFTEEIGALAEIFVRVEGTIFSSSEDRPDVDAIRLNLTRGDGRDLVRVLHPVSLDKSDQESMQALANRLPQGETQRIQILANLLWAELERVRQVPSDESSMIDMNDVRLTHDH
ncbi:MAG: hypothetical protein ACK5W0_03405 [Labrys sp. (in: a-proteobacteria)]